LDAGPQYFGQVQIRAQLGKRAMICGASSNCGALRDSYLRPGYRARDENGDWFFATGSEFGGLDARCSLNEPRTFLLLEGEQVLNLDWDVDLRDCRVSILEVTPGETGSAWMAQICRSGADCLQQTYLASSQEDGITTLHIGESQLVDHGVDASLLDGGVDANGDQ
jgi:hypothetical protein